MAHGQNAQKHFGRDYWSRRLGGAPPYGKFGKVLTHRVERRQGRELVRKEVAQNV